LSFADQYFKLLIERIAYRCMKFANSEFLFSVYLPFSYISLFVITWAKKVVSDICFCWSVSVMTQKVVDNF